MNRFARSAALGALIVVCASSSVFAAPPARAFVSGKFGLELDGAAAGITGLQSVSKVEPITVKLPLLIDPSLVCLHCDPVPVPPIDFPTVSFTLADAHADSVYQWLNDFVLNGNNDDSAERTGALNFVASGSPRFTLNFSHLGIFEISSDTDAAADAIKTVTVSMYCEQMSFDHSSI